MTGDQLRAQRRAARISQEGLARILAVSARTIRRYERKAAEPLRPFVTRALESAIQGALKAQRRAR